MEVRADADAVVVIAVAPDRVERPVVGRASVICEYLEAKGLRAHAVHVRGLREGTLWTSLRGRAVGGVVPALHRSPRTWSHRSRLPHLGGAALVVRLLVAACAAVAMLVCAVPALAAPPDGQPGVVIEPHSGGQAGVTAPPRIATPVAMSPSGADASTAVVSQDSTESAQAAPASSGRSAPSWSVSTGSTLVAEPASPAEPDTVRVGAVELPRPDWVPVSIAARERGWNTFLTDRAATAIAQAGLGDPRVDAVLGAAGGNPVPVPQELACVQTAATDPQALIPVAAEVAEPLVSAAVEPMAALAPQAADAIEGLLAQLPAI
ncbi:hypothetical protein AWN90_42480 [Nocardia terpenica]|uniref:Uncharacterized protein n=1 Tax=Nocardia terpenica TaxID=455432 RepID=A0A164K9A5_9NOCA|nr:hypothetical protein AWN90_42480 [Nocardia terpenica]